MSKGQAEQADEQVETVATPPAPAAKAATLEERVAALEAIIARAAPLLGEP